MFDKANNWESENLDIFAITNAFRDYETNRLIQDDTKNLIFVVAACLIYMIIHQKSIFLAVFSLFNIFMSIPIALFIYKKVLGINYFSSLHLSVVIIIVGIGCDDIFVFHD